MLLTRKGDLGQYITLCQSRKVLTEEDIQKSKTNVNKVTQEQHKMVLDGPMETAWEVHKNKFPSLYDLGLRLLAFYIQ